jgi:hypothetical protein
MLNADGCGMLFGALPLVSSPKIQTEGVPCVFGGSLGNRRVCA